MKIEELFESLSDKEIRAIVKGWITPDPVNKPYDKRKFGNYKIVDGKIEMNSTFKLSNTLLTPEGKIPFAFGECSRQFFSSAGNLTSLWEFPRFATRSMSKEYVNDAVIFTRNHPHIKTLEGITPVLHGGLWVGLMLDLSMSNIHKYVKQMYGALTIPATYEGPILGVLLIKGITGISLCTVGGRAAIGSPIYNMQKIMNECIKNKVDVLDAQERLIDAGLKAYAKL